MKIREGILQHDNEDEITAKLYQLITLDNKKTTLKFEEKATYVSSVICIIYDICYSNRN